MAATEQELPRLLKVEQAAAELNVTTRTVENWIRHNVIRSRKIGGSRRIPRAEIVRLSK